MGFGAIITHGFQFWRQGDLALMSEQWAPDRPYVIILLWQNGLPQYFLRHHFGNFVH